jgi:hypothetical protein
MIHVARIIHRYMKDSDDGSVTKWTWKNGEWVSLGESELPIPKRSQRGLDDEE